MKHSKVKRVERDEVKDVDEDEVELEIDLDEAEEESEPEWIVIT